MTDSQGSTAPFNASSYETVSSSIRVTPASAVRQGDAFFLDDSETPLAPVFQASEYSLDGHDQRDASMSFARSVSEDVAGAMMLRDSDPAASESLMLSARKTIEELWKTVATRDEAFAGLLGAVEVAVRSLGDVAGTPIQWESLKRATIALRKPFVEGQDVTEHVDRLTGAGFDFLAPLQMPLANEIVITISPTSGRSVAP